jgi:hypothetical protein
VIVRGVPDGFADFIVPETFARQLVPQRAVVISRLVVGANTLQTHRRIN